MFAQSVLLVIASGVEYILSVGKLPKSQNTIALWERLPLPHGVCRWEIQLIFFCSNCWLNERKLIVYYMQSFTCRSVNLEQFHLKMLCSNQPSNQYTKHCFKIEESLLIYKIISHTPKIVPHWNGMLVLLYWIYKCMWFMSCKSWVHYIGKVSSVHHWWCFLRLG